MKNFIDIYGEVMKIEEGERKALAESKPTVKETQPKTEDDISKEIEQSEAEAENEQPMEKAESEE